MNNFYDDLSDSDQFRKFIVNELMFCEYKCPVKQKEIAIWSHTNIFLFVLSGKKKWKTTKGEYMIHKGDAILIKKGAVVVEQYFDESFCGLAIFVPDDFIKNVIETYQLEFSVKIEKEYGDKIIRLNMDEVLNTYFHSIYSYFLKPGEPPKKLLKIKFEELIVDLITSRNNREAVKYIKEIFFENKISIREVMEKNFAYNLRLDEYARLCGRSLSAFKRDFQNTFGISPGKWLVEKRLEYSKYLLENSNKTVDEIIFYSGFKNQSHFIRIFKEKFGITPSKFRKKAEALQPFI